MGLSTGGFPWRTLAGPGARVPAKVPAKLQRNGGSKWGREGKLVLPFRYSSTSISALPSRLLSYSIPPCTELDQAGPTRGQVVSEECDSFRQPFGRADLFPSISALRTEGSDSGVVLTHL